MEEELIYQVKKDLGQVGKCEVFDINEIWNMLWEEDKDEFVIKFLFIPA